MNPDSTPLPISNSIDKSPFQDVLKGGYKSPS